MKYTVKCTNIGDNENGVIGIASIVIDDKFAINSIRLVKQQNKEEYAIHYPARRSAKTESGYSTIAYPSNNELAAQIRDAVLNSYNSGEAQEINTESVFSLSTNVRVFERGNLRGMANVRFSEENEFKILDVVIREGKNGVFVDLPSYRKGDGTFANVMNPITKEFHDDFNQAIISDYQKKLAQTQTESIEEKNISTGSFKIDKHRANKR